ESAHLPPAARAISLQGSARDVLEVIDELSLPEPSQIIGPVAEPNGLARVHIGVPWRHGADMSHQLRTVLAQRQAAHRGDPVRVHVDPAQLG
ncbi:MAG: primosome assembly protein PriA, partial [Actinobacteria bacterium]|nr:primosome assembly protein PriA [Actinomycetota bacterium]